MQINMFHKSAYHLHEDTEVKLLKMQKNRICPLIVLCYIHKFTEADYFFTANTLIYLLKGVLSISQDQENEKAQELERD